MNIAYVRVSTIEQNEERQRVALEKHNIDKWFIEKVSAKDMNRPQLKLMLEFCREGDCIFTHDFSRLARSTKDLLSIVDELKRKKVDLVSNKESLDTSTPTGTLILTVIAAINEFERTNLLERQREGIAIAKAKGKFKGRKPIKKPDNWNDIINLWRQRRITSREAMKRMGLKTTTFYKLLNEERESAK